MKVVHRDPEGGAVTVNPHSLATAIANSPRRAAAAVICGDDLAISTISCTSHDDTAGWAGFHDEWIDNDDPGRNLDTGMLRLTADENGITVELWPFREGPDCPYAEETLAALYDRVRGHPRLRRAIEGGYDLEIAIHDEEGALCAWTYGREGLRDGPDAMTAPYPA